MNSKLKDITRFFVLLGVLILVNVVVYFSFFRIDLTEDQRYSVAEPSKKILGNLESKVYVSVFLHGNFPARFKNLENAIEEKLEAMKVYGGANLQYKFVDPTATKDSKERNKLYQEIVSKGIQPTTLHANEDGNKVEKLIFPGAIVSYNSKLTAINFLNGNRMGGADVRINQAIEKLEFEFTSAIRRVTQEEKKKIAFLDGHGELSDLELNDIMTTLSENYLVGRMNVATVPEIEDIDAIVIAKPQRKYTEADKYKIDQFVMNGGKLLVFADALESRKDSNGMVALPYETNLTDLFFRYGFRLNKNMIQDLYAAPVPVNTSSEYKLMPWSFFPLLTNFSKHPIVSNMDALIVRNLGTVDTIKAPGIKKIPLVFTSQYTRVKGQPVAYSADELRIDLNRENYTAGSLPVSFLLEGNFLSLFANRPAPENAGVRNRKNESVDTQILVVSDGDFVANEVDPKSGKPFQLGLDKYSRQVYANADFIRNAVDYMLDENGIVSLRSKKVELRPLDKFKVEEEETYWKALNMIAPILLLILFGVVRFFLRKHKYTKFK